MLRDIAVSSQATVMSFARWRCASGRALNVANYQDALQGCTHAEGVIPCDQAVYLGVNIGPAAAPRQWARMRKTMEPLINNIGISPSLNGRALLLNTYVASVSM